MQEKDFKKQLIAEIYNELDESTRMHNVYSILEKAYGMARKYHEEYTPTAWELLYRFNISLWCEDHLLGWCMDQDFEKEFDYISSHNYDYLRTYIEDGSGYPEKTPLKKDEVLVVAMHDSDDVKKLCHLCIKRTEEEAKKESS